MSTCRISTRPIPYAALLPVHLTLLCALWTGCSLWDGFLVSSNPDCVVNSGICSNDLSSERPDQERPADFDLDKPGPYEAMSLAISITMVDGSKTKTEVFFPSDDGTSTTRGPARFPVVVASPALNVPTSCYHIYAKRLASYGIVTVLQKVEDETHHGNYRDFTKALIDWLESPKGEQAARVKNILDLGRLGLLGHSFGATISLLTAVDDMRVKAVLAIDPVDLLSLPVKAALDSGDLLRNTPILYLGETISTSLPAGAPCTPSDRNYDVLHKNTRSPSQVITFTGAAHYDFLGDCDGLRALCPGSSAPKDRTSKIAVRTAAAYFLRYLYGNTSADSYLSGDKIDADVRGGYVTRMSR